MELRYSPSTACDVIGAGCVIVMGLHGGANSREAFGWWETKERKQKKTRVAMHDRKKKVCPLFTFSPFRHTALPPHHPAGDAVHPSDVRPLQLLQSHTLFPRFKASTPPLFHAGARVTALPRYVGTSQGRRRSFL
ncbi:hypothetical protein MAPG_03379 [Magnaporthiopsis poae ATCC 64411]|uniref:Uncharacterized protein n=1 Tax=Magnaporthiopsis poae (strain ATCC 64411 / 73-15) TaxID=644358 RepID=A0A0C4DTV2_MAGP6|nr:hypothetical protein MAPG_03379 [Magnaporthiopsis poae ATCC 64411]